jgi:putative peptide zinc metalloprotease protein
VIVGDPATGQFISMPPVGGVVIRALQRGASITEAAAEAKLAAGEDVDVAAFVETLAELGFTATGAGQAPVRTAPLQQSRWLGGVRPAVLRPFFSRPAWICYIGALCFSACCLGVDRRFWPHSGDLLVCHDYLASLAIVMVLSLILLTLHESGHWLAARAQGLPARFSLDRRLIFPVVETDLSQLWGVPRRLRYGPLFAGMAADSCVLATVLAIRLSEPAAWEAGRRVTDRPAEPRSGHRSG